MNRETNETKRKRLQIALLAIQIVLLILTAIMIVLDYRSCRNGCEVCDDRKISQSQKETDIPTRKSDEDGYTELIGYGLLTIDGNYPFLYLQNPKDNDVYMSFDVLYEDNILYSSDLIEPGMMEQFDVYRCLDAGQHTLTYSIKTYDMESKQVLWSGIQQKQDILINR